MFIYIIYLCFLSSSCFGSKRLVPMVVLRSRLSRLLLEDDRWIVIWGGSVLRVETLSCCHVKSWVNLLTWLLRSVFHSCAANQEPAYLLTQILTITTTHKFPSRGAFIILKIMNAPWIFLPFLYTVGPDMVFCWIIRILESWKIRSKFYFFLKEPRYG